MKKTDLSDEALLDDFFRAAREEALLPDADLLARIMADADDVQSSFAPQEDPAPRRSLWAGFSDAIGGWGGMGGLVAASAFGLWLGVSPSTGLAGYTDTLASVLSPTVAGLGSDFAYLTDLAGDI